MKDTLSFLVQTLLKRHQVEVDYKELDFQIKSHPSYPSLHAITGVLNHFKIENIALKISVDEETIGQLPSSFLAQVETQKGTFFSIVDKTNSQFHLTMNNKEKLTLDLNDFIKQFTGVIVAIENAERKNYNKTKNNFANKITICAVILLSIVLFTFFSPAVYESIHFALSLLGLWLSVLIVQHDVGISSKIVDAICSKESNTTNCDNVLRSEGSKIFDKIKLTDISLIYFAAISFSWLLISITKIETSLLFILSLLTIPAVIYSLYYQKFIAKSWCTLCLGIVSVLIAGVTVSALNPQLSFEFSLLAILLIGFSFTFTTGLWLYISNKLAIETEYNKLKIESTKFKRNFNLFKSLLYNKTALEYSIPKTHEITFGNKSAPLNITIITNPFCGHCKTVHNLIESILEQFHEDVLITVRFNIDASKETSDVVKITSRLLEIYHHEGELDCLNAMYDIYNDLSPDKWLSKYRTCTNIEPYLNILQTENNWCKNHNINFTPEILLNGRSFPSEYNREDLIYFIEDLAESCIESNSLNTTIEQYSE